MIFKRILQTILAEQNERQCLSLPFLILSEKDGSGIDFFKKLRTALINAALWGKQRFLLTGLVPELGPATADSTCDFSLPESCSSTSILLSSVTPVLLTYGCSVSIGTSSDWCGCEGASDWVPCISFVSMATPSCWLEGTEGSSGDSMGPWWDRHFFISCCIFQIKTNKQKHLSKHATHMLCCTGNRQHPWACRFGKASRHHPTLSPRKFLFPAVLLIWQFCQIRSYTCNYSSHI